jgi:hypothetical protein
VFLDLTGEPVLAFRNEIFLLVFPLSCAKVGQECESHIGCVRVHTRMVHNTFSKVSYNGRSVCMGSNLILLVTEIGIDEYHKIKNYVKLLKLS